MMIHARPTPLRPLISTVTELDAYLAKRLEALALDCYDDDATISADQRLMSIGAFSALTDLRGLISEWLSDEEADHADDAEYDRWKDAYRDLDPVGDALEIRRLAGDR